MASLEKLPHDIHFLILLQHDSLQSLHSHIRASRQSYYVFLIFKARILFTVLSRLLKPLDMRIPLAAVKASLLPEPRPLARDTILKLMDDFTHGLRTAGPASSVSLPVAVGLCQLHWTVEAIIKDYVRRCDDFAAHQGITLHLQKSAGKDHVPISSVELTRLRRAFYSSHTYGRLFICSKDASAPFEPWEVARLFFQDTPSWQVEELTCVAKYFRDRVAEIHTEVQNDFVRKALAEGCENGYEEITFHGLEVEWRDLPAAHPRRVEWNSYRWPDNHFDFQGRDIFFAACKHGSSEAWVEYQGLLGLPFFRQLISADIATQKQLVVTNLKVSRHTLPLIMREHLASPLKSKGRSEDGSIETREASADVVDDASHPNLGWTWLYPDEASMNEPHRGSCGDRCIEWGYSFWDRARLRSSGLVEKSAQEVVTHWDDSWYHPFNLCSVEERLTDFEGQGPTFRRWRGEETSNS